MRRINAIEFMSNQTPATGSFASGAATRVCGRRAVVSVMVLVVLMILASMMAQYMRRAVVDRRQMQREFHLLQTQQLAGAGIRRALEAIRQDDSYTGETWTVSAGLIHQTNSGTVTISLQDDVIVTVAHYPANFDHPCQVTRRTRLNP